MTYQRRRGLIAKVYLTKNTVDDRGNRVKVHDDSSTVDVPVWIFPQRSGKAEVAGQVHINIIRIGTRVQEGLDLWSRVELMGKSWDIAAPPAYHHGTRSVRHYSVDLRERP